MVFSLFLILVQSVYWTLIEQVVSRAGVAGGIREQASGIMTHH